MSRGRSRICDLALARIRRFRDRWTLRIAAGFRARAAELAEHDLLDQGGCYRCHREHRNESGETTVNKTRRKHLPQQ
jgi:hypothetical protein